MRGGLPGISGCVVTAASFASLRSPSSWGVVTESSPCAESGGVGRPMGRSHCAPLCLPPQRRLHHRAITHGQWSPAGYVHLGPWMGKGPGLGQRVQPGMVRGPSEVWGGAASLCPFRVGFERIPPAAAWPAGRWVVCGWSSSTSPLACHSLKALLRHLFLSPLPANVPCASRAGTGHPAVHR